MWRKRSEASAERRIHTRPRLRRVASCRSRGLGAPSCNAASFIYNHKWSEKSDNFAAIQLIIRFSGTCKSTVIFHDPHLQAHDGSSSLTGASPVSWSILAHNMFSLAGGQLGMEDRILIAAQKNANLHGYSRPHLFGIPRI